MRRSVNPRSVVIRGERVRLYKSPEPSSNHWFADQADRTFVFVRDGASWRLWHRPREGWWTDETAAGSGHTMQAAADNSELPGAAS